MFAARTLLLPTLLGIAIATLSPRSGNAQQVPDYPTGGTIATHANAMPDRADLVETRLISFSRLMVRFRSGVYQYRWISPLVRQNSGKDGSNVASRETFVRLYSK